MAGILSQRKMSKSGGDSVFAETPARIRKKSREAQSHVLPTGRGNCE
jgi:hypothetical protein